MSAIWKDLLATSDNGTASVDLPSWLSRATLDAIGEGVFEDASSFCFVYLITLIYSRLRLRFRCFGKQRQRSCSVILESVVSPTVGSKNCFLLSYKSSFPGSFELFGSPPNSAILLLALVKYLPESWASYFLTQNNAPRTVRAREHQELVHDVARKLVAEKYEAVVRGKGSRDVMSLIGE